MIDRLEHDKLQAAIARCERAETRMGQLQAQLSDMMTAESVPPPSDSLAEAIVLRGLLLKPHLIARYDPALILVFPEHRIMLACMKRAYAGTHGLDWGLFYIAWLDECERARPGRGAALCALLDTVAADESRLSDGNAWGRHDWLWWWQRLKDMAEARRLVSVAQSMAERAWQGDVQGARQVAARATPRPASNGSYIEINIP